MAGAGWDGRVHVWDVEVRELLCQFGGVSRGGGSIYVALSATGSDCFVGTYYAWGLACIGVSSGKQHWRRTDLKRFFGLTTTADGAHVVAWFDGRAGLTLDARTGETRNRHVGLRGFYASRSAALVLACARSYELWNGADRVYRWPRETFTHLAAALSPGQCAVSESTGAVRGFSLTDGRLSWRYHPRPGAHVIELDFSTDLDCFVAIEYAYTDEARQTGPMVALIHIDGTGDIRFRKAIRDWPVVAFCQRGNGLLNGLGELYNTHTGDVDHVFEFPR